MQHMATAMIGCARISVADFKAFHRLQGISGYQNGPPIPRPDKETTPPRGSQSLRSFKWIAHEQRGEFIPGKFSAPGHFTTHSTCRCQCLIDVQKASQWESGMHHTRYKIYLSSQALHDWHKRRTYHSTDSLNCYMAMTSLTRFRKEVLPMASPFLFLSNMRPGGSTAPECCLG